MAEHKKYLWEKSYPKGLSWDMDIPAKTLPDFFNTQTELYADRPFLNFLGKEWSYGESRTMTDKIAKGLEDMGVKKGTKVGLFLPNTPYSIWFYYAIIKIGGTVVNYNPLYTNHELAFQIENSETEIMVTVDMKMLTDKMFSALENTPLKKVIVCPFQDILPMVKGLLFPIIKFKEIARVERGEKIALFEDIIDNGTDYTPATHDAKQDTAVLQYTGGTTGRPKGAMLTHQNIYANAAQVGEWMTPLQEDDRQFTIVGVLPFFHVFAMTAIMNMSLYKGMRILLQPNFELKKVLKLIDQEKPDLFAGVPAIYNAMAKCPTIDQYDLSSLKFCISGGAPLPGEVKKRFEAATGCPNLAEGYGLTEASPVTNCNPVLGPVKVGTIGLPLPNTVIEIIDQEDKKTVLPVGEKGELCIRGPQVMKGYYNNPEETESTIKNGRLHTGDIGVMDEDGYVTLVDRIKDLILVRGYNVYPSQIEEAIYQYPDIEECIVAGVPDEERGETVHAWIKPEDGKTIDEAKLKEFLKERVSPIEIPRKFIFRDEPLPKTSVGKLSRKDLLKQEGIKK